MLNKHNVRVRVCGIHVAEGAILLLKHEGIGPGGFIWSPPGGGVEPGETAEEALIREVREETHLEVTIRKFLFVNEYRDTKHHAMELFFQIDVINGTLTLGCDPEYHRQILTDAQYLKFEQIEQIDDLHKHNAFRFCSHAAKIINLRGYYNFQNI